MRACLVSRYDVLLDVLEEVGEWHWETLAKGSKTRLRGS